MRITSAHTLYRAFGADHCAWAYSGDFNDGHTADLIPLAEAIVEQATIAREVRNRFAYIIVEAFQNVIRHGNTTGLTEGLHQSILLRAMPDECWTSTCNPIKPEDEMKLDQLLTELRGMSVDQLKDLFLDRLQANKLSPRGGAGLGLIEMARRSRHSLMHSFANGQDGTRLLRLHSTVTSAGKVPGHENAEQAESMLDMVSAEGAKLVFKGRLGPGIGQIMVRIIERGIDARTDRHALRTRAWLAAMELVSSPTALGNHGSILLIGPAGTGDMVSIGLHLPAEAAENIMRSVNELNAMDPIAQSRVYREGLLAKTQGRDANDLGLFDLARSGGGQVQCLQEPHGEGSFVTLAIQL
jgi:hypothetical protein